MPLSLFHDTESNQTLLSQSHIWTLRGEKGAGTETLMVGAVMLLLCPWPLPFLARYRPSFISLSASFARSMLSIFDRPHLRRRRSFFGHIMMDRSQEEQYRHRRYVTATIAVKHEINREQAIFVVRFLLLHVRAKQGFIWGHSVSVIYGRSFLF